MISGTKTLFLFAIFFIIGELDTLYSEFLKHFYHFIVVKGSTEWVIQCLVSDVSILVLILLIGFQIDFVQKRFEVFVLLITSYWVCHLFLVNPDPYKYKILMRTSEFFLEAILSSLIIIKFTTIKNNRNIEKIMWLALSIFNLCMVYLIVYQKLIDYSWEPVESYQALLAFFIVSLVFYFRLKAVIDLSKIEPAEVLPDRSFLVLKPIHNYESFLKAIFFGHAMHTALLINEKLYTFEKGKKYFGVVDKTIADDMIFIGIPDISVRLFENKYQFTKVKNSCRKVVNRIIKNQTGLSIRKVVSCA